MLSLTSRVSWTLKCFLRISSSASSPVFLSAPWHLVSRSADLCGDSSVRHLWCASAGACAREDQELLPHKQCQPFPLWQAFPQGAKGPRERVQGTLSQQCHSQSVSALQLNSEVDACRRHKIDVDCRWFMQWFFSRLIWPLRWCKCM